MAAGIPLKQKVNNVHKEQILIPGYTWLWSYVHDIKGNIIPNYHAIWNMNTGLARSKSR